MNLNTKVKRSAICAGVSLVRSARKWAELVTVYSDFLVKGDKMLAK